MNDAGDAFAIAGQDRVAGVAGAHHLADVVDGGLSLDGVRPRSRHHRVFNRAPREVDDPVDHQRQIVGQIAAVA